MKMVRFRWLFFDPLINYFSINILTSDLTLVSKAFVDYDYCLLVLPRKNTQGHIIKADSGLLRFKLKHQSISEMP